MFLFYVDQKKLWSVALYLKDRGAKPRLYSGWQWAMTGDDAISILSKQVARMFREKWTTISVQACEITLPP